MSFFHKTASVNCDNKPNNQCNQFKRKNKKKKNEANINFTHFHRKKRLKLSKSKDWLCGTVTQTEKNINTDILSV